MRLLAQLITTALLVVLALEAHAGLQGLSYVVVSTTDSTTTYRVFANFSSPADEVVALYGTANAPWSLSPTDVIVQSPVGSAWATEVSPDLYSAFPDVVSDSWFTIGSENSAGTSDLNIVGLGEAMATFENGEGFVVDSEAGGTAFVFPGSSSEAIAGGDLKVLIAQLTMAGPAELTLNIQWRPNGGLMVYAEGLNLQIPEEIGCTDVAACNYDPTALLDDGSCFFDIEGLYDCDGSCLADADGDGICDALEIQGCTTPQASNYDSDATDDDGSCDAPGCSDPTASNFAPWASEDDGSCFWLGCTDTNALNPDPIATVDDGSCAYPPPSYHGLEAELIAEVGGVYTHRVYASFSNPLDELVAVFGNDEQPLSITSGSFFTQDSEGISGFGTPDEINAPAPDSWLALGSAGNTVQTIGMAVALGAFEMGLNLLLDEPAGGTWFVLPGEGLGTPMDGRVLIGQFASESLVSLNVNLQYRAQSGETVQAFQQSISFPNVPAGCLDASACNFDSSALISSGECEYYSCQGCTDPAACNYSANATQDDGNCVEPESGLTCDGLCLIDSDDDGVCDDFEVDGCTNPDANNFNVNATDDDGTCEVMGCTDSNALNYNPGANTNDGGCLYEGCTDPNGLNYDFTANVEGPCEYANPGFSGLTWAEMGTTDGGVPLYRLYANFENSTDVLMAVFGSAQHPLSINATAPFFQATGGSALLNSPAVDNSAQDSWLTLGTSAGSASILSVGIDASLAAFETGDNLVIDGTAGGTWFALPGDENSPSLGTPDSEGRVLLAQLATTGQVDVALNLQYQASDGSPVMVWETPLTFPDGEPGCMDATACNYEPAAFLEDDCIYPLPYLDCLGICLSDADGDDICDELEIPGCTDSDACNFMGSASDDDGSCYYATIGTNCDGECLLDTDGDGVCEESEVTGCQDETACNFNTNATDAGYCDYPEPNLDCNGQCVNDADQDGTCDPDEVLGCSDPWGCNFSCDVTEEDGSCTYPPVGIDCSGACILDLDEDGICDHVEIVGCMTPSACNYNPDATDSGECWNAPNGFDCDGNCITGCNGNGSGPCSGPDCCGENTIWDPVAQTCIPNGPNLCGENTIWDPVSQTCIGFDDCPADVDGNGIVALTDLLAMLSAFGQPCE